MKIETDISFTELKRIKRAVDKEGIESHDLIIDRVGEDLRIYDETTYVEYMLNKSTLNPIKGE